MCGTRRRMINKKGGQRKETQIKFNKIMTISTLTYNSEGGASTNKQ
jgi:hypothetical protein